MPATTLEPAREEGPWSTTNSLGGSPCIAGRVQRPSLPAMCHPTSTALCRALLPQQHTTTTLRGRLDGSLTVDTGGRAHWATAKSVSCPGLQPNVGQPPPRRHEGMQALQPQRPGLPLPGNRGADRLQAIGEASNRRAGAPHLPDGGPGVHHAVEHDCAVRGRYSIAAYRSRPA